MLTIEFNVDLQHRKRFRKKAFKKIVKIFVLINARCSRLPVHLFENKGKRFLSKNSKEREF